MSKQYQKQMSRQYNKGYEEGKKQTIRSFQALIDLTNIPQTTQPFQMESGDVLNKGLNDSGKSVEVKTEDNNQEYKLAKDIIETIDKRKGSSSIGTITRIYSYCKKIINCQEPEVTACQGEGENSSRIASVKSGSETNGKVSDNPSVDIKNKKSKGYQKAKSGLKKLRRLK